MESRLCPRCGAYWKCDCPTEIIEMRRSDIDRLALPEKPGCDHDWTEAVGVEVDMDLIQGEAQVMVCRLCGIYAVEEKSA